MSFLEQWLFAEPDVTLTDYGLTIECAFFTYLLHRTGSGSPLKSWFMFFFSSISIGALAGGTVHGFFPEKTTTGYAILWTITLLAMGVTTLVLWAIGARIQFSSTATRWITAAAVTEFGFYCLMVVFVTQEFSVVIFNYVPAVAFLFIVIGVVYVRTQAPQALLGLGGLMLSLVASWVQYSGFAVHPTYFNHNVFYHVLQAMALLLIFLSARWFMEGGDNEKRRRC